MEVRGRLWRRRGRRASSPDHAGDEGWHLRGRWDYGMERIEWEGEGMCCAMRVPALPATGGSLYTKLDGCGFHFAGN